MDFAIALTGFVFISTITPGPNNLLLAASGLRFDVRRSVPHVLGIHLGVYLLILLCGLGLGQLLLQSENALFALRIFGSLYLLYLAWKILGFRMPEELDEDSVERPMTLFEAGLFQFSNPKAWMMATTGLNIGFAAGQGTGSAIALLCVGFATLGIGCNFAWVWAGSSLRRFLAVPVYRLLINGGLALITLATVGMLWLID